MTAVVQPGGMKQQARLGVWGLGFPGRGWGSKLRDQLVEAPESWALSPSCLDGVLPAIQNNCCKRNGKKKHVPAAPSQKVCKPPPQSCSYTGKHPSAHTKSDEGPLGGGRAGSDNLAKLSLTGWGVLL